MNSFINDNSSEVSVKTTNYIGMSIPAGKVPTYTITQSPEVQAALLALKAEDDRKINESLVSNLEQSTTNANVISASTLASRVDACIADMAVLKVKTAKLEKDVSEMNYMIEDMKSKSRARKNLWR